MARNRPPRDDFHKVIGYVRVSTDKQEESGAGQEAQRQGLQRACEQRGWELVRIAEDVISGGKSADDRKGLAGAIADIKAGTAGTLMATKVDRLSRSTMDFGNLLDQARREGWNLLALDLGIDLSTPLGEAMATIVAVFAQLERRLIGERTKAAMAVLKANGKHMGRRSTIAPQIRDRILQARADGQSYRSIAIALNSDGVPGGHGGAWTHRSVAYVVNAAA